MVRYGFLLLAMLLAAMLLIGGCSLFKQKPKECIEEWNCSKWSNCVNGLQTRTCNELNGCGTETNKPREKQECSQQIKPGVKPVKPPETEPDVKAQDVQVTLGQEEIVYDWSQDQCEQMDLMDVDAHAIRNYKNEIVLASGNAPKNYFMFGQDFDHLKRNCKPVLVSGDKWAADSFDHQEWVASVYTEDGKTIYALIHDEYHDPYAQNCKPGITDPSNKCWFNFISAAKSTDGGHTFTQLPSPQHLVAMLPYKWDPIKGASTNERGRLTQPPPQGYMEPSNIIKGQDGYYYSLLFALTSPTDASQTGVCVMRTDNLDNPQSWKIWDGNGYNIAFLNPYPNEPSNPEEYLCSFVSKSNIDGIHASLTYNTYLGRYMVIGPDIFPNSNNKMTCGFWFSLSDDLINWDKPQLIKEAQLGYGQCSNNNVYDKNGFLIKQEAYPSLIDHNSEDRSFATAGKTAYLYYMKNTIKQQGNYLIRVPITFNKK